MAALSAPELVTRWFDDVWNRPRQGAVEELFAVDGRMYSVTPEPIVGRDAFREFRTALRAAFSEFDIRVVNAAETGDAVLLWFHLEMVHTESGRRISVDSGGLGRFVDGQLSEARNFIDFLEVLKQMGAAPEDALERALGGESLVFPRDVD